MIDIVHAVSNFDGVDGDSSGKEILRTKWYKRTGGWTYLLMCNDEKLAQKAADIALAIAANDKFGYSKETGNSGRWSGYKSINAYINLQGYDLYKAIECGRGNFDCSSLCISAYILAGLRHATSGYTGSIPTSFVETGLFTLYEGDSFTSDDIYAKVGALYVTPKQHVAMAVENGSGTSIDISDPIKKVKSKGNVRVRSFPATGRTIDILRKDYTAEILGVDEATGWYKVKTAKATGYVTNNSRYILEV